MGEGAGVVILEELEFAQRAARRSTRSSSATACPADAYHITAPSEDGDGGMRVMAAGAAARPASQPQQVDYINAHGTSTPHQRQARDAGDQAAVRRARAQAGDLVDQVDDRPPARRRRRARGRHHRAGGQAPGRCRRRSTTSTPDPDCDLDYVPQHSSATATIEIRAVELVRLRRHQRRAAVQEDMRG